MSGESPVRKVATSKGSKPMVGLTTIREKALGRRLHVACLGVLVNEQARFRDARLAVCVQM